MCVCVCVCVCVYVCVCVGERLSIPPFFSVCMREQSLPLCTRDLSIWTRERERVRATELLAELEEMEEEAKWRRESDP